jgi:hypothetical protein
MFKNIFNGKLVVEVTFTETTLGLFFTKTQISDGLYRFLIILDSFWPL